jgi:hypothetical protein
LADYLRPFAPLVGKTWRGKMADGSVDISRWERTLNGTAVRVLHSVNDGEYAGETIVFWDRARKALAFYYFTTAGFLTHGTYRVAGGTVTSIEAVEGNQNGITEVEATTEILPGGGMQTSARYLQDGKWVPGHSALYEEDPLAEVKFR